MSIENSLDECNRPHKKRGAQIKYLLFIIMLLASIGAVNAIDCIFTCSDPGCCYVGISDNATGSTLIQGQIYYGYTVTITMVGFSCTPGDSLTASNDCQIQVMQNTSATEYSAITTTDTNRALKCANTTTCTKNGYAINYPSAKYPFLIKGSKVGTTKTKSMVRTDSEALPNSSVDEWTTSIGSPTITLSKPDNNTITDSENVIFMANWTGLMDCDNMSLWFNTTKNFTTPSLPLKGNISTTVHFDEYFFGYWNATCCYSHSCSGGGQRNFTFTRMPKFNVSLTLPENNSNRSLFNWTWFVANQTADMRTTPDNYSIYVNGSYLNSENLTHNLSLNLSFLYYGNTTWDTYVCWQHWCRWSINGNNTFIRDNIWNDTNPTVPSLGNDLSLYTRFIILSNEEVFGKWRYFLWMKN